MIYKTTERQNEREKAPFKGIYPFGNDSSATYKNQ